MSHAADPSSERSSERDSVTPCSDPEWPRLPADWRLKDCELHLAAVRTDGYRSDQIKSWADELSDAERQAARRLRFPGGTERAIVSYAALRRLLGRCLTVEPGRLQISRTPYGKPYLLGNPPTFDLQFNLSHSADLTLIAVTSAAAIGVDVERIKPDFSIESVSSIALSDREQRWLASLRSPERVPAFYRLWTRKEALLKAAGVGLAIRPAQLDVLAWEGEAAVPLDPAVAREAPALSLDWEIHDLQPAAEYAAAVAVARRGTQVSCWTLSLGS